MEATTILTRGVTLECKRLPVTLIPAPSVHCLEIAALGEKRAVLRELLKTPRLKTRKEAKRAVQWVTA